MPKQTEAGLGPLSRQVEGCGRSWSAPSFKLEGALIGSSGSSTRVVIRSISSLLLGLALHHDRVAAIVAFLVAGVVPSPSPAMLVTVLANARRSAASFAGRVTGIEAWLAEEIKHPGVRENAAVLAGAECSPHEKADRIMSAYLYRHPAHAAEVDGLRVAVLGAG